jgi:hypothetical protein
MFQTCYAEIPDLVPFTGSYVRSTADGRAVVDIMPMHIKSQPQAFLTGVWEEELVGLLVQVGRKRWSADGTRKWEVSHRDYHHLPRSADSL